MYYERYGFYGCASSGLGDVNKSRGECATGRRGKMGEVFRDKLNGLGSDVETLGVAHGKR